VSRAITIAAAVAAGIGTFAFRYLAFADFSNDHYLHLARAQQMLMGALPVRDFNESGLPLMSALSAGAQAISGPGLHAEVVVVAVMFALAAALSVVAARAVTRSAAVALLAVAATVVASPVSYSYPKLLPYAAALAAAALYAEKPDWMRLGLLAAAVVFGFLLRHDHGMILGVGAAAVVVARHWPLRTAAVPLARLVAIGVLLAAPYLIWVQMHEGLGTYIRDGIDLSRREASKAVWDPPAFRIDRTKPLFEPTVAPWRPVINVRWTAGLPEPYRQSRERLHGLAMPERLEPNIWRYEMTRWSSGTLREIVEDPAIADTNGIHRSEHYMQNPAPGLIERWLMRVPSPAAGLYPVDNGVAVTYYVAWLLPLAATVVLWRTWPALAPGLRALVVMAIVVQLLMNRSMLRDPLVTRVRDVVAPVAVLLPFVLAALWPAASRLPARVAWRAVATLLLVLTLWGAAAAGSFGDKLAETRVGFGWAGMRARAQELREELAPPHERMGRLEMPVVDYLRACTPPDSRLLTLTFAPELFFFTGRGFAAGHDSLLPGFYDSPRHETLAVERLAAEDVPFVIADSETEEEMPAAHPRLHAYVHGRFREVARFAVAGEKRLIVLADASRPPKRTFGDDQLPCFHS
jgi:hypothetical protein